MCGKYSKLGFMELSLYETFSDSQLIEVKKLQHINNIDTCAIFQEELKLN